MDADRPLMDGMYPSRSEQIKKYLGILVALVIALTITAWRIGRWEARRDTRDTREAFMAIFNDDNTVALAESAISIDEQVLSAEDEDTLLLALCAKQRWWDDSESSLRVIEERLRPLNRDHLSAGARSALDETLGSMALLPAEMDRVHAAIAAMGGCQGSD